MSETLRNALQALTDYVDESPDVFIDTELAKHISVAEAALRASSEGTWQPIIQTQEPGKPFAAASAWLYGPSLGVWLGSFGRFADGVAFGSVPGLNGCIVRDWGATHWQPAHIPAPPQEDK